MNAWAATVLSMRGEDDDGVVLQLVSGTPNLSFEAAILAYSAFIDIIALISSTFMNLACDTL